MKRRAVVLLSGGLDSAVTLFWAKNQGFDCRGLAFYYGQRHAKEMHAARQIARYAEVGLEIVKLTLPWKGSSLIDNSMNIPSHRKITDIREGGIPSTYVPARNTIFLSMASSFAEAIGADTMFIGAHFEDSSGYPDCRKEYLEAFNKVIRLGTKRGLEESLNLEFPLIDKTKREIVKLGAMLNVPFHLTWSCYNGEDRPCGVCDSCVLRAKGFREAGLNDPAINIKECPV